MLHGRESPRAEIARLVDAMRSGRSGVLVLRGEAGIGKSALLDEAAAAATEVRVLRAAGVEAESALPFAGLHMLLRPALGRLDALPGPQASALRAALGLAPAVGEDRFLVGLAVLTPLAELAEERPVLCLVDDAHHWLDPASVDALLFTARRLGAEGVALVFAAREDAADRFDAPGLPELVLDGLDPEAAAELLAERAPELAAEVRERIVAESAGNPLALLELAAGLTDEQRAGRAGTPHTLPIAGSVLSAFRNQIHRLPAGARLVPAGRCRRGHQRREHGAQGRGSSRDIGGRSRRRRAGGGC